MRHTNLYQTPPGNLIYHPQCFNTFSSRGEEMVEDLMREAPKFYNNFNFFISIEKQRALLRSCFLEGRQKRLLKKKDKKSENKSFFDKDMTFRSLVSSIYKRTNAPRLTALGGTLHGMHKDMTLSVLKQASQEIGGTFIDIDLSACHANIASATQND